MSVNVDPDQYYALLRALKGLPKEANNELRKEAGTIAETIIKPKVEKAILQHAGNFGPKLVKTIRVGRDRIPKVRIGANRKNAYSGGATATMIRYGTVVGPYYTQSGKTRDRQKEQLWPQSISPGWPKAASDDYTEPVFNAWQNSVKDIVIKWNRGG